MDLPRGDRIRWETCKFHAGGIRRPGNGYEHDSNVALYIVVIYYVLLRRIAKVKSFTGKSRPRARRTDFQFAFRDHCFLKQDSGAGTKFIFK
jgi:hypothetical protein